MFILKPMGTPGVAPAHVRAWTQEEDEIIIRLAPTHSYRQISDLLPYRTYKAVRHRAALLIEQGKLEVRKCRRFNYREEQFIRRNARTMTADQIAEELGRSRGAILNWAWWRGVSLQKYGDNHPLTKVCDADVNLIHALRDEGLTFREIAKKFELSRSTASSAYHQKKTADYAVVIDLLPKETARKRAKERYER